MSYITPYQPLNLCPICGGEFKKDYKTQEYVCKDCGDRFPWTMLNVTMENIEDLDSLR